MQVLGVMIVSRRHPGATMVVVVVLLLLALLLRLLLPVLPLVFLVARVRGAIVCAGSAGVVREP